MEHSKKESDLIWKKKLLFAGVFAQENSDQPCSLVPSNCVSSCISRPLPLVSCLLFLVPCPLPLSLATAPAVASLVPFHPNYP